MEKSKELIQNSSSDDCIAADIERSLAKSCFFVFSYIHQIIKYNNIAEKPGTLDPLKICVTRIMEASVEAIDPTGTRH